MPLWLLLALLFVVISGASAGAAYAFFQHVLAPLLTGPDLFLATTVAFGLAGAMLVIIGVAFLILARLIALPLRRVSLAMTAFAKDSTRMPVSVPFAAPREIKKLVTAFAEMAAGIDTAHQRDVEVSRTKSDFITTAAHQLRTPLTAIRWALEALEKSGLTPDQAALAANAEEKSKDLVAIVGTLLDISSIESGKYQYSFVSVDALAIAEEVAQDLGHTAAERQVSLFVARDVPMPLVRADKDRIKWVLDNLVENAIRYTPANGSVRITAETANNLVYLHVSDTGIGISPGDRGNIFERFYRAGNAVTKENEGNGLGLYIARRIVTDHGGDLNFAANKDGPGTTFTLSLPLAS